MFAVWQPMLPTGWADLPVALRGVRRTSAAVTGPDSSACETDEERCARTATRTGLLRADRHFLGYGGGVPAGEWSDRMPPAIVFNGPVVDVIETIEDAVAPAAHTPDYSTMAPSAEPRTKGLVFLTRGRRVNTTVMRRNLDEALKALGLAAGYEMVDQNTLPETDVRGGYPTATPLYANRPIFLMSVPKPPLPILIGPGPTPAEFRPQQQARNGSAV